MDQQELIARVRAGDPEAERRLYDANVDRVYRLAFRMTGDDDLAADYTQETFIRVFRHLEGFRGEAALSTWITSITISVIYNGQRRVKRQRQRETDLDDAAPVPAPVRAADPDLKERLA